MCGQLFQSLLEVKKRRVLTVARGVLTGAGFAEKRGGKRENPVHQQRREAIMSFIRSLRVNESHYARKNTRRLYLSSEWNVRKLWRVYNGQAEGDLKVLLTYTYSHSVL